MGYSTEEAAHEHAERLEELSLCTQDQLIAKIVDLSERYNEATQKLESRNTWLFLLGVVLAIFIGTYWFD
jgi:hypothetical protein